MTTSDGGSAAATPEDLAQLKAERDRLKQENEKLENRPAKRRRTRKVVAVVLVVLTLVSLTMIVPGGWIRRTVVNTDRYVALVGPLIQDPAVQEYISRQITTEVFTALGVQERVGTALANKAPALVFLSGPITTAVQGFVQDQVQKLVATDTFQNLWVDANRVAQTQVVAILEGGGSIVSTADGKVVLNLIPLVNDALANVSQLASDLLGRQITLPTISSGELPADAIAKIETATGIQLPSDFGQIQLADSSQLAAAQQAFTLANRTAIALALAFFVFFIGAMWVSVRRRRTLIQLMSGSAVILVLERRLIIASVNSIVEHAKPENQAAVRAVVDAVKSGLLTYTGRLLAVAVVVLLASLLTGPYRWAVALRGYARDLFEAVVGAARGADRSAAGEWVAAHRDPLLLGGGAVFVLSLILLQLSGLSTLIFFVVVAAYAAIVWRIAAVHDRPVAEDASRT